MKKYVNNTKQINKQVRELTTKELEKINGGGYFEKFLEYLRIKKKDIVQGDLKSYLG